MHSVWKWIRPLLWLAGWIYLGGALGILAFLLFIESAPYIYLMVLPIPVLAPAYLLERAFGWHGYARAYVLLAFLGVAVLLGGRVWLDLWYPMDL